MNRQYSLFEHLGSKYPESAGLALLNGPYAGAIVIAGFIAFLTVFLAPFFVALVLGDGTRAPRPWLKLAFAFGQFFIGWSLALGIFGIIGFGGLYLFLLLVSGASAEAGLVGSLILLVFGVGGIAVIGGMFLLGLGLYFVSSTPKPKRPTVSSTKPMKIKTHNQASSSTKKPIGGLKMKVPGTED